MNEDDSEDTTRVYEIRIIVMDHGWTMTTTYYDIIGGRGPTLPHDYRNGSLVKQGDRTNPRLDYEFRAMAKSLNRPCNYVEYSIEYLSPAEL